MTSVPLTWQDLVDILLIGFLLYRLFVLFMRSHALQILLAVLTLYVLQLAARSIGLVLTSWFFETIRPVVIVILVVVFRNELREMILHTNPIGFLMGRTESTGRVDLAELCKEVFSLATERVGALIVLTKEDSLLGIAREGFELDARFDPRLIRSIFLKDSPLHDGAVVIEGDRLVRVGALLPLSLRSDISPEYGTRHRAALGASEHSDAVIIVSSEERGEVTVVHRDQMVEPQNVGELEIVLENLWSVEEPAFFNRSRVLLSIRHMAAYAATCLAVGGFWWFFFGTQQSMITVRANVDFQNTPENLVLDYISDESVEVQVRGRRVLIDSLRPDQLRVSVDLANQSPGLNKSIPLRAEDVQIPPGLEVVQFTPSRIRIDLVRRVVTNLSIEPVFTGKLVEGYRIGSMELTPPEVSVVGPESVFTSQEARATTQPINLSTFNAQRPSITADMEVVLFPASIQTVSGEPAKARVALTIVPITVNSTTEPEPEAVPNSEPASASQPAAPESSTTRQVLPHWNAGTTTKRPRQFANRRAPAGVSG